MAKHLPTCTEKKVLTGTAISEDQIAAMEKFSHLLPKEWVVQIG